MFQPQIETMALPQLRTLQNERLKEQLRWCYERIPFYRKKLDEAGIDPQRFRGLDDLHRLPFTKKTDLRDNYPFGLFAVPRDEVARIHCSSGTTGKPTVVGYTAGDLEVFAECVARSLAAAGCRPGMLLQNAYGYGLFTGGLGLHYGAEKLGMTVLPISGGMTERQLMLLGDFGADAIAATPSYALTLAESMQRRGMDPGAFPLKLAILGAEPWTESIRSAVEQGLGVTATNIYGLSEIMGPGVSQEDFEEQGSGSYIWEDHFFPEVVDRYTGEPLPEGQPGVLVFTTLTKKATPVLRYWTNDITSIHYDRAGKRTHVKMGQIIGRADDMLIIRGVNLFHTQIEAVLQGLDAFTTNYQLIVSNNGKMDEVLVRVEINPVMAAGLISGCVLHETDRFSNAYGRLLKKIKDDTGLSMQVELLEPGAIPRSEGGKLNRIIDQRKPGG